ncbi:acyltransferase [Nocardioides sp. GCM10027113]|uniref:acyltransferase family protein n=1 Tax=unclassified Nocardioides TaxID=2615069 RepID=UPI003622F7C7
MDRNRVVDLLRATALVAMVLGHWVMAGLYVDRPDGPAGAAVLRRDSLLALEPWTHPFTWVLQVMPVFFLVGGYVNALSWRRSRARGATYGWWLRGRVSRLARPLVPLLVAWSVLPLVAPYAGVGTDWVGIAARAALVPTWFLAIYLLVVAAVPMTLAAWERWGWGSVATGVVAMALLDLATLNGAVPGGEALASQRDTITVVGALLVWCTVHQVGYAWVDRRLGRVPHRLALGLGSGLVLAVLVAVGPYGVSMVGVAGHGLDNTVPPRVTLVLLGLAQAGLLLAAEGPLRRLVARDGVWLLVVALNRRVMTTYLWHMTALGLAVAAVLATGLPVLDDEPASAAWWWTRPVWFVALGATTLLLVALVGRFEEPAEPAHRTGAVRPLLGALGVAAGLGLVLDHGLLGAEGQVRWWLPLLPVLAVALSGTGSARGPGPRVTRPGSKVPAPPARPPGQWGMRGHVRR